MKKTISFFVLVFLSFTLGFSATNAASGDNDIVDTGDQTVIANSGTGDTTDLGTPAEENTEAKPLQDVFYTNKGEDNILFDFDIEDATEAYATTFNPVEKDFSISEFKITGKNGEEISQDLKDSFIVVVKRAETGENEMFILEDLNTTGTDLLAGDEITLVYNPDGIDNSEEISILGNVLNVEGKELPTPLQFGIATLDDNLNVTFDSEVKDYEETENTTEDTTNTENETAMENTDAQAVDENTNTENYGEANAVNTNTENTTDSEIVAATENDKKAISKTDTGPVGSASLLLLGLLSAISFFFVRKK